MLLEKAYAKLHGSFAALRRGSYTYGLLDLTGGVAATIGLGDSHENSSKNNFAAWRAVAAAVSSGAVVGCSTPSVRPHSRCGICTGQLYAILETNSCDSGRMVRVASPWGSGSCIANGGKGARRARQIGRRKPATPHATMRETAGSAGCDGVTNTFWLTWAEFVGMFASVHVCQFFILDREAAKASVSDLFKGKVHKSVPVPVPGARLKGSWKAEKGQSTLLAEHGFVFTVAEDNTHFIAALHQRDARWETAGHERSGEEEGEEEVKEAVHRLCPIGVAITQIQGGQGDGKLTDSQDAFFSRRRDVAIVAILQKGSYVVNCSARDLSGEEHFTVSLAASAPFDIVTQTNMLPTEGPGQRPLVLPRAPWGASNDVIEYAASRELQGLQQTIGQLANSIQCISMDIRDLGMKVSCLQEIIARGNGQYA